VCGRWGEVFCRHVARGGEPGDRGGAATVEPGPPAAAPPWPRDPDIARTFYAPTAFRRQAGDLTIKGTGLGVWSVSYAVTEEVDLGGQMTLPVMVFGAGLAARWSTPIGEWAHVGVTAQANFVKGFHELHELFAVQCGGGPILSLGNERFSANFSFSFHGIHFRAGDIRDTIWVALPSLGLGARVHRMVRLMAELHFPFAGDKRGIMRGSARDRFVLAFLYGVRVHSESFFGDIGFVIPYAGGETWTLKAAPFGYPLLSFGFTL
jgi:hypothetical protein